MRRSTASILMQSGWEVESARDGLEGWVALQARTFDLLITDHDTPGLSGLKLVAKARLEGMNLPIIITSSTARVLGGNYYEWLAFAARLDKPFTPEELLRAVLRVLGTGKGLAWGRTVISPVVTEAVRHCAPYPHWGINE